jgi:hypothetical protein
VFHVLPQCLALILCNDVSWDRSKAKANLLGTFHWVAADRFPVPMPAFKVWIELTNGNGTTPMSLRVTYLTPHAVEGDEVVSIPFTATFHDPRAALKHVLTIDGLHLRAAGDYLFSVLARGRPLIERYFTAQLIHPEEDAS